MTLTSLKIPKTTGKIRICLNHQGPLFTNRVYLNQYWNNDMKTELHLHKQWGVINHSCPYCHGGLVLPNKTMSLLGYPDLYLNLTMLAKVNWAVQLKKKLDIKQP